MATSFNLMKMEELIGIITKMQDIYAVMPGPWQDEQPKFAEIVVVGSQSSGKSSVLESIVGKGIYPRGPDLTTRCPLLLHLHYRPFGHAARDGNPEIEQHDWATFNHLPDRLLTDFKEVQQEVEAETTRITGSTTAISAHFIILHVYSANLVELTLVDFPGLVKVPRGDQPANIEEVIKNMIRPRIECDNAIILVVAQADNNISNTEAILFAKEVDPNQERTLLVLTKLDNMVEGSDATKELTGQVHQMKLGIVGVVNRSQKEIDEGMPLKHCLKKEAKLLRERYPQLASVNGIPYLSVLLSKLLIKLIQRCLPGLEKCLREWILSKESQLSNIAAPVENKRGALIKIILEFKERFAAAILFDGMRTEKGKLSAGANIYKVLYEEFGKVLRGLDPVDDLTQQEVDFTLRNCRGPTTSLFVNTECLNLLLRDRIPRIEKHCHACVQHVFQLLKQVVDENEYLEMQKERFPNLVAEIQRVFLEVLDGRVRPLSQQVSLLITIEKTDQNFLHSDFVGPSSGHKLNDALIALQHDFMNMTHNERGDCLTATTNQPSASADGNKAAVDKKDLYGAMIIHYFNIVRKTTHDLLPKFIKKFLIVDIIDGEEGLQFHLLNQLDDPGRIDELMQESEAIALQRQELENAVANLKQTERDLTTLKNK